MIGRLVVVPALIVCVLLAVAVVVVLFGSSITDRIETTPDLLARLENDSGERTLGIMLMPQAKEVWQAAQELARRFERKDKFLKPEEIEPTAQRVIALLQRFPAGQDVEEGAPAQQYFLMIALARLQTPSAVAPLEGLLADPNWRTRRTALQALAMMRTMPEVRAALPGVVACLDDRRPEVQVVACAAVAALANPQDDGARRALAGRLEADREIQWNAAASLARLGDSRGKLVLMNMLDRAYWEKLDLEYPENGRLVRRKFSENEVSNYLKAAVEAAEHLHDAELASLIGKLRDDKSYVVRDAARAANAPTASGRA